MSREVNQDKVVLRHFRAGRQSAVILSHLRPYIQGLFLAAFIILMMLAWVLGDARAWANPFFRLDPLAGAMSMLASRRLMPALLLSLLTIGLTLAAGRVWCSWVCPLGTLLDWMPAPQRPRTAFGPQSRWRRAKYLLLTAVIGSALVGSLTLLLFDPIVLTAQTVGRVFLPLLEQGFSLLERAGFALPWTRSLVSQADNLLRGTIFPLERHFYSGAVLTGLVFAGVLALNSLAPRFWCRHLCPLGALLGLLSRTAWLRRRVDTSCIDCGRCARLCPTGTIDAGQAYASDPAECTTCLICQAECPVSAITFVGTGIVPTPAQSYDPTRRQTLITLGVSLVGVGLFRTSPTSDLLTPYHILPPGGRENDLAGKCIRCGLCLKVCPTGGLQPAFPRANGQDLWTPVLIPRMGYCDYSCRACGQICPTGAIPNIPLDIKRTVIIGKAYIDTSRCIPWSEGRDCIVCEEMCPVSDKAIKLMETSVKTTAGTSVTVKLPHVERERCIGCGICEYQCPVAGEAAIRVYSPVLERG